MHTDEYFMKEAIKEAKKAEAIDEVPIGCVLVKDDKIIARGHNTREKDKFVVSHAEINAIKKASKKIGDWQLIDTTIYVTMEPCIMCAGAIYQSRIKRVVFGALDPKGGAFGSNIVLLKVGNLNHYPIVTSSILQEECSMLIKEFFKKKRKKWTK